MNLGIVGSRGYDDYESFSDCLDLFPIESIISGGCRSGADAMAEKYAKENRIPIKIIPPDWNKYGRAAGPIRNKEIVKNSTYILAFWDGKSSGTKSTIIIAKKKGVACTIIDI